MGKLFTEMEFFMADDLKSNLNPNERMQTQGLAQNPGSVSSAALDNDDVVEVLNDLIDACRDGERGFRTSAEHANAGELQSYLARRATDCATAATELEAAVRSYGGAPREGGTVAGALHRGWVSIKAALSSNDDRAVLVECERGEDAAVAQYRNALEKPLPQAVRDLVQRQANGAQRNHDEVKAMRDRYIGPKT